MESRKAARSKAVVVLGLFRACSLQFSNDWQISQLGRSWKAPPPHWGHLFVPVANALGQNWRWWPPSRPWRVLLPLSAVHTSNSRPVSASTSSTISPQHNFLLSSHGQAMKPNCIDKNHHRVLCNASGLWFPNSPVSKSFASSSYVYSRLAFGFFPRPSLTKLFLLAAKTLLEREKASSLRMLKGCFFSVMWRWMLFWKLETVPGS